MEYFEFDLSKILNVIMMNKECLTKNVSHVSRYAEEFILYFITKGTLVLEDNKQKVELVSGDVYIFNKGEYHKPIKRTDCEYYYIHFATNSITKVNLTENEYKEVYFNRELFFKNNNNSDCYKNSKCIIPKKINTKNGIYEKLLNIFENNKLSAATNSKFEKININFCAENIIMVVEQFYASNHFQSNEIYEYQLVNKLSHYIEKNSKNKITSKDIEKEFSKNYDYLNRVFKKATGMPIIKFRNKLRINLAKNKIKTTDLPLNNISEEVGFSDEYYFSRVFKSFEGVSPSAYRRIKKYE